MASKTTPKSAPSKANTAQKRGACPKQTKKSQLIELLSAGSPISVEKLSSALGWQKHTTSAAMTRLKQEGHNLISSKMGGEPRGYQITAPAAPDTGKANSGEADAKDGAA